MWNAHMNIHMYMCWLTIKKSKRALTKLWLLCKAVNPLDEDNLETQVHKQNIIPSEYKRRVAVMCFTGTAVSLSFECVRCLETSMHVECVTSALLLRGVVINEGLCLALSHGPGFWGRKRSCKMSNSPSQKLVLLYPCGDRCCVVCVCLCVCGKRWVLIVIVRCRSDLAQTHEQS